MALQSILEVTVPRDVYSRFTAGLARIGDLTVETEASMLPDQVRIALRILP